MDQRFVPPARRELPSKPVQELSKVTGDQVPEEYIWPSKGNNDKDIPYRDNNIIDLQLLLASSSPQGEEELRKLRSYLSSWGWFQLTNHGVAPSLIDQVHEVSKQFFALPLEEKQKHSRNAEFFEGYGHDKVTQDMPMHWNDRLHLKVYPVDHRNLKLWPQSTIPKFRETLDEYAIEMGMLLEVLLKAIAKSLNLEENSFLRLIAEECGMTARFNHYPPCPFPERVLGLKPHSDDPAVSIILQDKEVEGLQVRKDHKWFKIPIIPYALFINVGDQLEIMSNGVLKSPVHKVVIDRERERTSLAMFCGAHPQHGIGPLSELINDERPPLYKHIQDWDSEYYQYHGTGVRFVDGMKLDNGPLDHGSVMKLL